MRDEGMGDYYISICYKWGSGSDIENELRNLGEQVFYEHEYGISEPDVMWQKSLKNIATILQTARDLRPSEEGETREIYNRLRQKVKVWVRTKCHEVDNYIAKRAFWPSEVLDVKEVQDEIKILVSGDLLSKESKEDRRIVELAIKWLPDEEKRKPIEVIVDRWIGLLNNRIRRLGLLLGRATEIHRRYPDTRFWFYVEFD